MKDTSAEPTLDRKPVSGVSEKTDSGKVDGVVQEYMDNLLADLFPSVDEPIAPVAPKSAIQEAELVPNEQLDVEPKQEIQSCVAEPEASLEFNKAKIPLVIKAEQLEPNAKPIANEDLASIKPLLISESAPIESPELKTYAKVIPHVPLQESCVAPPIQLGSKQLAEKNQTVDSSPELDRKSVV